MVKIFDIDKDLMNHMRNEHYEHNKEFNCEKGEKCDFQTYSASYLRKHIKIKHEISFCCDSSEKYER